MVACIFILVCTRGLDVADRGKQKTIGVPEEYSRLTLARGRNARHSQAGAKKARA